MKKAICFLFIILMVSASLPCRGESHSSLLAPRSEVAVAANQRELEALLKQNNRLKKQVFSADKKNLLNEVLELLQQLGHFQLHDREQYILLRGALSWWLFFHKDVCAVAEEPYSRAVTLRALNSLEKSLETIFPEFLQESTLSITPVWNKENFSKEVFLQAYEQKEKINQWLVSEGRLAKALHIVKGISIKKLESAFKSNQVQVHVFSKRHGDYKYVLKLEIKIEGKPYYLALKKVYVSKKKQSDESVLREIAAVNMNHLQGLPIIGVASAKERIWLDDYILGYNLDEFVFELESRGFSAQQILMTWQQLQKEGAKKFILLCLRGFSGRYYVDDPHTGNIMAYWPTLQEHQLDPDQFDLSQIELAVTDVGKLNAVFPSFEDLPVKTTVVDVGRTQAVKNSKIASFFSVTYSKLFEASQEKLLVLLPLIPFSDPLTRVEFVQEILNELSLDEKVVFIAALLQGVPLEIKELEIQMKNWKAHNQFDELREAQPIQKDLNALATFLKSMHTPFDISL